MTKNQIHIRYLQENKFNKDDRSIESFEVINDMNLLTSSSEDYLRSYYMAHYHPDSISDEELSESIDNDIEKAENGNEKAKRRLLEALLEDNMTDSYDDIKTIDNEVFIVAKGVYADPEGTQYVEFYKYLAKFEGKIIGTNLWDDGLVVIPEKILSIEKIR